MRHVHSAIWMQDERGCTYCSHCGSRIPTVWWTGTDAKCEQVEYEIELTPYCPRCGARMAVIEGIPALERQGKARK